MKLTYAQLATIQSALALYQEKCEGRAEFASKEATFWKNELQCATELHEIFTKANDVVIDEPAAPAAAKPAAPVTEACGDINCDGQCQAKPEPAPAKPQLIALIDNAASVEDAEAELDLASYPQRRAAAAYLDCSAKNLPAVARLRVRRRLDMKAAA